MERATQERKWDASDVSEGGAGVSGVAAEKLAVRALVVLLVYVVARSIVAANARLLWFDELCTRIVALQPSVRSIWNALEDGADGQPFAFYVVERMGAALSHHETIAFRLPSILALACIILCVFIFVRRESGGACALICAAAPTITVLFTYYAIEARPYALVVGFIALALVCYQRAPAPVWVTMMAVCLALAAAMHYYGVLAIVPFGMAEAGVLLATRRIRIGVWLAMACGAVPLGLCWPLLAAFKRIYGLHFHAQASLVGAVNIYAGLFRVEGALGWALAVALVAGVLSLAFADWRESRLPESALVIRVRDYALACGFLALPAVGFFAAKIAHGGLLDRYVMSTLLGLPLALGLLLPRLGRRATVLAAVFIAGALLAQEASFWRQHVHRSEQAGGLQDSVAHLVEAAGYPKLPVVISDGLTYVYLAYYARPELAERIVSVVDAPASVTYAGSDSIDQQLIVLRTLYPLRVVDFSTFAAENGQFLLCSSVGTQFDWWPTRLVHDNYDLKPVAMGDGLVIYLATRPQESR
jgi:hypothetical protein